MVSQEELAHYHWEVVPSAEWLLVEGQGQDALRLKLLKEVENLPARQREAIFLRFYGGMEFPEIAAIMAVTPRAVYKLVYKAIDALQKCFSLKLPTLLLSLLFFLN